MITNNYCRLCMAEDGLEVMNSFTQNALRNEFSIVIHRNDGLSHDICKKCGKFIMKFVDFKRNAMVVQKVLKKVMKKKTNVAKIEDVSPTSSGAANLEETNASRNEGSSSDEKDVSIPESSPKRVRKRKRESSISQSKRPKIIKTEPTASSDELSDDSTPKEIPQKNTIIKIEDDDSDEKVNSNQFQCKFCSAIFSVIENLRKHLKKHHDGHLCTKCGYISLSAKYYAKHLRTHYNLTCAHRICSSCFKICNDQAEFYAHKKLVHDAGKSSYVCSDCMLEFVTFVEFEEHNRQVHKTTDGKTGLEVDENTLMCISDDESDSQSSTEKVDLKKSDDAKSESNCIPDSTARDEELELQDITENDLNSEKTDTSEMKNADTTRAETPKYCKSNRLSTSKPNRPSTSSRPGPSCYLTRSKRSRSPKPFHPAPSTSSEFAESHQPPPLMSQRLSEPFQRNTKDAQYIPEKHSSSVKERLETMERPSPEKKFKYSMVVPRLGQHSSYVKDRLETMERPSPKKKLKYPMVVSELGQLKRPTYAKSYKIRDGCFSCRLCKVKFYGTNLLELHYYKCIPRRRCHVCRRVFSCNPEMLLHKMMNHNKKNKKKIKPKDYQQRLQEIESYKQLIREKQAAVLERQNCNSTSRS